MSTGVTERLKVAIDNIGATYTSISQKTGIPVDRISKLFLNQRTMKADELILICNAINVDISDLMAPPAASA